MGRTSDLSHNRRALASSEIAACVYCLTEFSPNKIIEWIDGEPLGVTALCPLCGVDAVVGFNGPIDALWLSEEHRKRFS